MDNSVMQCSATSSVELYFYEIQGLVSLIINIVLNVRGYNYCYIQDFYYWITTNTLFNYSCGLCTREMLKCAEKFVQLTMAAEISLTVEGRGAKQPTASLNIRNPSSGAKSKEHIHLLLINTTPNCKGLGQPQWGWDEKVCIHFHSKMYKITDF